MTTKSGPTLPIADQPYWDLKSAEGTENVLNGIPDRCVCLVEIRSLELMHIAVVFVYYR